MKNLVLVDFTEESLHTLSYAIGFTKLIKGKLEIVNASPVSEHSTSYEKLQKIQKEYSTVDFELEINELTGSFDEEVPKFINTEKIGFVFCGTHDMKVLERLFSSRVLKLMNRIDANVIFIPSGVKEYRPIKHLVAPILNDKNSLQKLEVLVFLHQFMDFELTLCTYKGGKDSHTQNLYIATKILHKSGVPFSIKYIGHNEAELMSMIDGFANALNADMVSIVNLTETHLFNFGTKGFVEKLIRNKFNLPVLAVQNQQLETYSGFHTSGGY